jgi:hypothetical protein
MPGHAPNGTYCSRIVFPAAAETGDWASPSPSRGLVINESNGSWGKAIEVPGLGALDVFGAAVTSVSCPSAGKCDAVGTYTEQSGGQGFVAGQTG